MSPPETESRKPAPEIEDEQEVDFTRYGRAIGARWWVPIAGLVIGAVIGWLITTGTSRPYEATAVVYLGSPKAPGGEDLQNLGVNFVFAEQVILSDATIRQAADQVGLGFGALRRAASLKPFAAVTEERVSGPTNFAQIRVEGLSRVKARQAANALASVVETGLSSYVDLKLRNYGARRARAERELDEVNARIENAQEQQAKALADPSLTDTARLIILTSFNNVLQFNENRQSNLEGALLIVEENIAVAQQVERARVLAPAKVDRVVAPSSRTSAAIGGVIGLLIGILAALLWDPIAGRLESREQS